MVYSKLLALKNSIHNLLLLFRESKSQAVADPYHIDNESILKSMLKKFQILYQWTQKFIINAFSQQSQRKKFDVVSTRQTPVVKPTETNSRGGFTPIAQTRPRKCSYCGTSEESKPGNITKLENGSWKCKACGHTWRS